ncbi:MAG: hypothetical protein P8P36_02305 [Akkermansiaceae bacterium]|nr:hypothetical protein [Akkermansiaceae bacterium]
MKNTTRSNQRPTLAILFVAVPATLLLISSCAPDPVLQRQMEQDIITASELRKEGDTTGAQQGRGSQAYGYGGF